MNYKIWDRIEKINNVDAEYIINSLNIRDADGVFLVLDNLDEVQAIEIDRIIKSVYNLDKHLSVEEVAKEYIRIKEEERLQAEKDIVTLEALTDKISILEAENKNLKIEQEQQNEEILVNMLANTEMFEMLLGMMPMTLSEDKTKNNGGNSMIEVYCTLIIKGVKTIEDVPLVIREQVIERLKQLEVPVK